MKLLSEIIESRLNRRRFLGMALSSVATACLPKKPSNPSERKPLSSSFDFPNLAPILDKDHHVAKGFGVQRLISWGDALSPNQSIFTVEGLTAEEQEQRFGYGNDYIAYVPLTEESALLVINHESTIASLMFSEEEGYVAKDPKNAEIEMMAHGLSILEVAREQDEWRVKLDSLYNRRITAKTPMRISGPAAGAERMKTPDDPTGRLVCGPVHNCSGGQTPWGTILTCEENILYYFQGSAKGTKEEENFARTNIGYSKPYCWGEIEPRFSMEHSLNEGNRFGWVVEIDPKDPQSTPVKRTALGRFYHESANPIVNSDGRIVIYMGDDAYFEYLYRFVSSESYDSGKENKDLLDEGVLSVARFSEDGTVEWLPLLYGQAPLTAENRFYSQADVLIEARRAADLLNATSMDRVEDVEPNPISNKVYINCTKNQRRGTEGKESENPANPRIKNEAGHILELIPPNGDHASDTMEWDILLLAGDKDNSEYGLGLTEDAYFACPDNAVIDPKGRLWVTTDGSTDVLGIADGVYGVETDGEIKGQAKRLFAAPIGAEVTGPCFSPDGRFLFISVQHPGYEAEIKGEYSTRWPDHSQLLPPRPSVLVIRRLDGDPI